MDQVLKDGGSCKFMIHGKNLRKEGCMNNAKIVLLLGRQLAKSVAV